MCPFIIRRVVTAKYGEELVFEHDFKKAKCLLFKAPAHTPESENTIVKYQGRIVHRDTVVDFDFSYLVRHAFSFFDEGLQLDHLNAPWAIENKPANAYNYVRLANRPEKERTIYNVVYTPAELLMEALTLDRENDYTYYSLFKEIYLHSRPKYSAANLLKRAIELNPYSKAISYSMNWFPMNEKFTVRGRTFTLRELLDPEYTLHLASREELELWDGERNDLFLLGCVRNGMASPDELRATLNEKLIARRYNDLLFIREAAATLFDLGIIDQENIMRLLATATSWNCPLDLIAYAKLIPSGSITRSQVLEKAFQLYPESLEVQQLLSIDNPTTCEEWHAAGIVNRDENALFEALKFKEAPPHYYYDYARHSTKENAYRRTILQQAEQNEETLDLLYKLSPKQTVSQLREAGRCNPTRLLRLLRNDPTDPLNYAMLAMAMKKNDKILFSGKMWTRNELLERGSETILARHLLGRATDQEVMQNEVPFAPSYLAVATTMEPGPDRDALIAKYALLCWWNKESLPVSTNSLIPDEGINTQPPNESCRVFLKRMEGRSPLTIVHWFDRAAPELPASIVTDSVR